MIGPRGGYGVRRSHHFGYDVAATYLKKANSNNEFMDFPLEILSVEGGGNYGLTDSLTGFLGLRIASLTAPSALTQHYGLGLGFQTGLQWNFNRDLQGQAAYVQQAFSSKVNKPSNGDTVERVTLNFSGPALSLIYQF